MRVLTSARGLQWLRTVQLPGEAEAVLRRLERLLVSVHAETVAATLAVRERAKGDPIVTALGQVVGIGPILGLTLRAEIGSVTRFPSGRELASYAGLVPQVDRSAGRVWHGPITRTGSPWLRWGFVEAAMHNMRRQDEMGRWARHLAIRKGIAKARVALARVLCDEVIRIWRTVA